MTEDLYKPDCIRTFTGLYMNVFSPAMEMIDIRDIAHALSMQPRFGGHLPRFYSVAQHCVNCAILADSEHKLDALMHDAAEAYLLDMPRPIKQRLVGYKELEDRLMMMIAIKFGLRYPLDHVKGVDECMLVVEWRHIMLGIDKLEIDCWSPELAEAKFLSTFKLYSK